MRVRVSQLGAACIAAALAIAHSSHAATLRWANDGDVSSLDPYSLNETFQLAFLANIYEPLIRRNRDLQLDPALATSWEEVDQHTWRFHLRRDVHWQDGSPFTADDVVFSASRVLAETSMLRPMLASVNEVRRIDDLTVDFETKGIDPILPQEITLWVIMSKAWAERHDAAAPVNLASGRENYAARHTMGTGPFRLVLREPDRRTVLEHNPGWWDTNESNVDQAEFDVIGNDATRVAALLSGDIDLILSVPPQDIRRLRSTAGIKLMNEPELRTIFLGLDQSRDELLSSDIKGRNPLKDVRVRQAFSLAIDEQAIASRVMRGQAHPTWLMWGPGVNGYDAQQDVRPKADPVKAKQLMTEAGYPDGFRIALDCPNDRYVMDDEICEAIATMLARIGVKVALVLQTKAKFFTKIQGPSYDTDFYLLGWTPYTYDAQNVLYNVIASRNPPQGEMNFGGYSNPKVDDLASRIAVEMNAAKRNAMIREAAAMIQADFGYIPLHQQKLAWAAKSFIDMVQCGDGTFPLRYVKVQAASGP
ncbi:MAG: ABC transporter substrate-binding protein [Acetobacteraceae bacterium]|nr:ABC transporter substrate-binding protein [Acetobacteraceae bacterium]